MHGDSIVHVHAHGVVHAIGTYSGPHWLVSDCIIICRSSFVAIARSASADSERGIVHVMCMV